MLMSRRVPAPAVVPPQPRPAAAPVLASGAASLTSGELLQPAVVGERLGVSIKVLERWRGNGSGPSFVRLSRKTIRYRAEDVEAFVTSRLCASTAYS